MLTQTQLTTLKAAILAETDPTFVALRTAGATDAMAQWFNVPTVPSFYLWRTQYDSDQMRAAIVNGITQLDALTASKRDSLLWLAQGTLNMTAAASRTALDDLTGSQALLKSSVIDGGKRIATRGEKLFATGTGSFVSPATPGFEGEIVNDEIVRALEA